MAEPEREKLEDPVPIRDTIAQLRELLERQRGGSTR
jgi:hypothetical protein